MLVPFDGTLYTYSNEETNRNRKKMQQKVIESTHLAVWRMNIEHNASQKLALAYQHSNILHLVVAASLLRFHHTNSQESPTPCASALQSLCCFVL